MGACIRDKIKEKVFNVLCEYSEAVDMNLVNAEAACVAENICEALDITPDEAVIEDTKVVVHMQDDFMGGE
jgi:hypothetical protein